MSLPGKSGGSASMRPNCTDSQSWLHVLSYINWKIDKMWVVNCAKYVTLEEKNPEHNEFEICSCCCVWVWQRKAKPARRNLLSSLLFRIFNLRTEQSLHFHVSTLHQSFTSCREEAVAEQRQHRSVSTCGRSTEGGDWLQRHAQMERSPPLTGSQRAICSAGAIVPLCIKLFYVPHEFTASLKLAGLQAEGISWALWRRTKAVLVKCVKSCTCTKRWKQPIWISARCFIK